MIMDDKQKAEISFWQSLKQQHGDNLASFRHKELYDKTVYFKEFDNQEGSGLDLGSGLVSVLEKSGKSCVFIDPLMEEYRKIENLSDDYIDQPSQEKIPFDDNTFDWVFCVNVIDHTPDPSTLLKEIKRVLKPEGIFYFQVNFDPAIYAPHYSLWDIGVVENLVYPHFIENSYNVIFNQEHSRKEFWGVFKNNK